MIRSTILIRCGGHLWGASFGSGPEILEEIGTYMNKVGSNIELANRNLFQPFPSEMYIQWHLKRSKISMSVQFKGKRKVLDDIDELTEKIHDLEMCLRGRDEEVRQQ
ncbi:hypothetical protein Gotri_027810 [Gossypium trilobum]|uniref:Uncharacterized protein n=1 Tax=Gossypium trilobum TaxID=34281 RepID=A0A7J9FR99_9ROSI|nr:hypothetical protein [Gossypium trilobum]